MSSLPAGRLSTRQTLSLSLSLCVCLGCCWSVSISRPVQLNTCSARSGRLGPVRLRPCRSVEVHPVGAGGRWSLNQPLINKPVAKQLLVPGATGRQTHSAHCVVATYSVRSEKHASSMRIYEINMPEKYLEKNQLHTSSCVDKVTVKVYLSILDLLLKFCKLENIKGQRSSTPSVTTHLSGSNNFQDTIRSFSMGRVSLC